MKKNFQLSLLDLPGVRSPDNRILVNLSGYCGPVFKPFDCLNIHPTIAAGRYRKRTTGFYSNSGRTSQRQFSEVNL